MLVISIIYYYGGLIVTGALCCFVYERVSGSSQLDRRRALAAIAGLSVYKQALSTVESTVPPLASGFFDFDLVLLEDELLDDERYRQAKLVPEVAFSGADKREAAVSVLV